MIAGCHERGRPGAEEAAPDSELVGAGALMSLDREGDETVAEGWVLEA